MSHRCRTGPVCACRYVISVLRLWPGSSPIRPVSRWSTVSPAGWWNVHSIRRRGCRSPADPRPCLWSACCGWIGSRQPGRPRHFPQALVRRGIVGTAHQHNLAHAAYTVAGSAPAAATRWPASAVAGCCSQHWELDLGGPCLAGEGGYRPVGLLVAMLQTDRWRARVPDQDAAAFATPLFRRVPRGWAEESG